MYSPVATKHMTYHALDCSSYRISYTDGLDTLADANCSDFEFDEQHNVRCLDILRKSGADCVMYRVDYFDASGNIFRSDYFDIPMTLEELQATKQQFSNNTQQVCVLAFFALKENQHGNNNGKDI